MSIEKAKQFIKDSTFTIYNQCNYMAELAQLLEDYKDECTKIDGTNPEDRHKYIPEIIPIPEHVKIYDAYGTGDGLAIMSPDEKRMLFYGDGIYKVIHAIDDITNDTRVKCGLKKVTHDDIKEGYTYYFYDFELTPDHDLTTMLCFKIENGIGYGWGDSNTIRRKYPKNWNHIYQVVKL